MKPPARPLLLIATVLILTSPGLSGEDDPEIDYDIYIRDTCLTVWVDMTRFLTSRAMERLKEGVDLAIECRASLVIPRKFWGDRLVAEQSRVLRLSYHKLTDDFILNPEGKASEPPIRFGSMAGLFQLLRDSITICLATPDQLDASGRHAVQLRVTAISLTDLNLAEEISAEDGSDSPIRYLFCQFLRLTNYGRDEYSTRSRSFSVPELEVAP